MCMYDKQRQALIPGIVDYSHLIWNAKQLILLAQSYLSKHQRTWKRAAMWNGKEIPNNAQQLNSEVNHMPRQ